MSILCMFWLVYISSAVGFLFTTLAFTMSESIFNQKFKVTKNDALVSVFWSFVPIANTVLCVSILVAAGYFYVIEAKRN